MCLAGVAAMQLMLKGRPMLHLCMSSTAVLLMTAMLCAARRLRLVQQGDIVWQPIGASVPFLRVVCTGQTGSDAWHIFSHAVLCGVYNSEPMSDDVASSSMYTILVLYGLLHLDIVLLCKN